jgi:hypothetical protein
MSAKLLLKIAAVFMLTHSASHILLCFSWQKSYVPTEVVQKMQEIKFHNMMFNADLTMADLYTGASCFGIILVLLIGSLLWILSDRYSMNIFAVKVLWIVEIAIILHVLVELIYYFPIALIFCIPSAIFVLIAIIRINKLKTQQT